HERERIVLQGDVPSPINPPSGCRFHPRCRYMTDICREVEPPLTHYGNGHFAACHHPLNVDKATLAQATVSDRYSPAAADERARPRDPGKDEARPIPGSGEDGALKPLAQAADSPGMDAAERKEILSRYMDHQRCFEAVAAKRQGGNAEVIPFNGPLRELEQEPTMREIEVLQLISDGLVNREIGHRLFLSEETVKSHVRHLLAKLQARSRAHAV